MCVSEGGQEGLSLDPTNMSPGPDIEGLRGASKAEWVKMVLEDELTELGSSRRPHVSLEPALSHHSLQAACLGPQLYHGGCPGLKQGVGPLLLLPLSLLCQLWCGRHLISEPPSPSSCSC